MGNGRYSNNPLFTQLGLVTVIAVLIGGFAVTPGYGQAMQTTTRESVPFSSSLAAICGGEEVLFSGRANIVTHVTVGPDGEFLLSVSHVNLQQVKGVTASGDRVVLTDASNQISNIRQLSENEFSAVATSQIHGTLITRGSEINTVAEILFHITINANGETTSTVERVDVRCVG